METRSAKKRRLLLSNTMIIMNPNDNNINHAITTDRISELPDDLLHQILSLLPIKTIAQTSLLSKRWRSLWSTFPYLNFTTCKPVDTGVFSTHSVPSNRISKATDYVSQVLTLRDVKRSEHSDIRSLRFQARHSTFSCLNDLIRRAIRLNVQELDVEAATEDYFNFPRCVVSSESLRVLRLKSRKPGFRLPPQSAIQGGFRSLQSLFLSRIFLCNQPSVPDFFSDSSFPVLKILRLEDCLGLMHLKIEIRGLQVLGIENCFSLQGLEICGAKLERLRLASCFHAGIEDSWVKIDAPRLEFLVWENNAVTDTCRLVNLNNLKEASINTSFGFLVPYEDVRMVKVQSLSDFFAGLSCARSLIFESQCVELLSNGNYFSVYMHPFKNLGSLEVQTGFNKKNVHGLACIFRSSPVLHTLTIKIINDFKTERRQWDRDLWDMSTISEEELYWESQTENLESFLRHLRMVTIHGFLECENEVSLAKFLLKHGKALQKMTLCTGDYVIYNARDSLRRQKIRSQIMGFSWASSSAKITIL